MKHTRNWFRLNRHDDPEPAEPEGEEPTGSHDPAPEGEDESEPEGAEQLGDAGKKALDRMKAERAAAKKEAAAARKAASEAQRRIAEYEDRDKSELDKATSKVEKAEERAAKATERAVKAEVKALASDAFADPTDADLLGDLARYVDGDGDIDAAAIASDLADLLERKPHLRKQVEEPKKKQPKPDPGQGARPAEPPTDYRTADRDDFEAELARTVPGFRLR